MPSSRTAGTRSASAPAAGPIVDVVLAELAGYANAANARGMSAYMKTSQPYLGVKQPVREPACDAIFRRRVPISLSEYRANVISLWEAGTKPPKPGQTINPRARRDSQMAPPTYSGPREMMYAACHYAERFKAFHTPAAMPIFKRLIVEGGWWDIVDWVAIKCVGGVMKAEPAAVRAALDKWIDDRDLWLRRTAIIAQVGLKDATNEKLLFAYCLRRADETDFFIRKAIGWSLRQHARTNPDGVRAFLLKHIDRLSPLSVREAGRHIGVKP